MSMTCVYGSDSPGWWVEKETEMNLPIFAFDETTAASVTALTAALGRVADNQERLLAGQQAAIDKLEGGKPATTRSRKTADPVVAETAKTEAVVEPKPETVVTETPKPVSFLPAGVTDADTLKAYVSEWTGAVTGDDKVKRVDLLKAIAQHLGVEPKFAPLSADAAKLKQALFFIERSKADLPVDFSADYDFAGDPKQGGASPAADADSGSDFD
jgi:hypothetical protein